jgi:hypothetical protein
MTKSPAEKDVMRAENKAPKIRRGLLYATTMAAMPDLALPISSFRDGPKDQTRNLARFPDVQWHI